MNMEGVFYSSKHRLILASQFQRMRKKCKRQFMNRGSLKVTGRLGEVMSESSQLAYTYAKRFLASKFPENTEARNFIERADIHLHFPEGAIPKDGPSAGITITTALMSLALNRPIVQGIGMTGEITLNGKVSD